MAVFTGNFSTPGTSARIRLELHANQVSQNITNNTSTVSWVLQMVEYVNGSPWSNAGRGSAGAFVNSWVYRASGLNYNFSGTNQTIVLASGSTVVAHDADGRKSIWCEANYNAGGEEIGNAACSGTLVLSTIPRATQPTVDPAAGFTGDSFTIGHKPATTSFFHDILYSLDGGNSFTTIRTDAPGTDVSTNWTPPHNLLPNDGSKIALIRAVTRASAGGTIIGTKDVSVNLTVPANIKPVVSSVAFQEAQLLAPNMVTLMGGPGRYVRRWSKLRPTVTSTGAGGSSVVSSNVTMAGQQTQSGVAFTNPIDSSGAVSFNATAIDSRGRSSDNYYHVLQVKAYDFPNLPVPTIVRTSDAAGMIPSPTGTYLRITPSASVSKLDFDGEKNLLEWMIRTRPKGGTWVTEQVWTNATVSGNTIWTTPKVIAGYAASTEYEVEVSIRDLFGKNGYDVSNTVKTLTVKVPSESVFMDWNEERGIGLGRYHSGTGARVQIADGLDVASGDLSVDGVSILTSTTSVKGIVELATNAETQAGSDAQRAVTPAGLKSVTATETRAGLVAKAGFADVIERTNNTKFITPSGLKSVQDYDSSWERVIPTSVNVSTGAAPAFIDPISGVITLASATDQITINGLMDRAYEYMFVNDLLVNGKHPTNSSLWFRMARNGVVPAINGYQTAGSWSQYDSTTGVYASNNGAAGAIGMVSGNLSAFNPFHSVFTLSPAIVSGNAFGVSGYWFNFHSITQGSARATWGSGYTGAEPTGNEWNGVNYFIGNTGALYGEVQIFRRKLKP